MNQKWPQGFVAANPYRAERAKATLQSASAKAGARRSPH
jgi:hypothetical protein